MLDRSTGQARDVSTLSGGESFLASLALALGLSDAVQSQSGQIRMDAMFIDEGFGSLDENALRSSIDVLLELDPARIRLAGFVMNQRVLTLDYDGKTLHSQRHPLLPTEVDAAHVLRDVQLVYWPASALQAALPPGWTLDESERARVLRSRDGSAVVTIRYAAGAPRWIGTAELDNAAEHYRLRIESALQPEEAP